MNKSVVRVIQNKKTFIVFANIVGVLLVSISISISLYFAQHQAVHKETLRLKVITSDVLERMHTMRVQFAHIVDSFSKVPAAEACSDINVKKMQEEDVTSFFLQAVGHISGNTIDCSSLPQIFNGMQLGEPYGIEKDGTRFWANLKTRKLNAYPYVVLERNGYAAVIVPKHSIEALGNPEISVGIFNIKSKVIYTSRGLLKQEWIQGYEGNEPKTFIDHDNKFIVYMAPNESNRSAVIAAMPIFETIDEVKNFAKLLIPLGVLLGLGLAGGFLYLAKVRYSRKSELVSALARNEFFLEFQPIIDLRDKTCVGAEALIRWNSPNEGNVRPDLFIPIAEETGFIGLLTKKVFELIAVDMGEILRENPHFHIGINVSSSDLQADNLLNHIAGLVKSTGINNAQIIIEATERGFLNDGISQCLMKRMRDTGIKVAIDDFGTGYSSLSYLTKFDLDYLKIDKTFVDAIGTDAVTGQVAFHIIEMAKSLHLFMIAEGVETEKQADILLEHGVTLVQGWLFSKALSPKDFIKFLKMHS